MVITPSDHVADIVAQAPGTIAVFQRHEIAFCCAGRVPLRELCEREGRDLEDLIEERMRSLTSGYEPPADACPTFRGLYYGLSELAHRMRLHVHLENDILFPRALALGRRDDVPGVGDL